MPRSRKSSPFGAPAFTFILMMGVVDFFGDLTYEGGASINGQFLHLLGASAAAVSIAAGLGEFLGYALRPLFGYISDKTGRYWVVTFIGYAVNLLAVPAMALAGNWRVAAALILLERIGRAIRKPPVEGMLSFATGELGKGWVYALNTVADEMGATIGPLIVTLILTLRGDYRTAFAILLVSSVLAFASLLFARMRFPTPSRLEVGRTATAKGFGRSYRLYMAAGACFAAGLMSYELLSFHLAASGVISMQWIPALLAYSTACGVVANLALGKMYDRLGFPVVLVAVFLSSLFAPFVFLGGFPGIMIGLVFLGIGYAVQDTLLSAIVAGELPEGKRNLAFGLFYAGYGVGWLAGSLGMGLLYGHSRVALVAFVALMQLVSLPVFMMARRAADRR
jgi:MFS family permease